MISGSQETAQRLLVTATETRLVIARSQSTVLATKRVIKDSGSVLVGCEPSVRTAGRQQPAG